MLSLLKPWQRWPLPALGGACPTEQGIPINPRRAIDGSPLRGRGLDAGVRLLVLLALCLGLAPASPALAPDRSFSDYVSERWGVEQGLPQISVLSITQDPDGYLWLGTQNGLARFDGQRFTRYTQHDAKDLATHIQALQADAEGRLWIGTTHGLLVLEQGQFRRVAHVPRGRAPQQEHFPVAAMAWADGRLLVAGPDGVYTVQDGRLLMLHALPGPALSLLPRKDGLWVGSIGQVLQVEHGSLHPLPLPAQAREAPVNALAEQGGRIWAGTRDGLYHLHGQQWQAADGSAADPVVALRADRDGNLWVARSGYFERLLPDGRGRERITAAGGTVRAVYEDRDGSLWLGSTTDGVTRLWSGWGRRLGREQGLANPLLWTLAEAPDGKVWVGGSDGVEVWDGQRFQRLVSGAQLPHPEAYSLLVEADQAWIGTRAGAVRYANGRIDSAQLLAPMRDAQVNGIVRDRQGRLWFATTTGLYMLPPGSQSLQSFGHKAGLNDLRIRLVHQTRDGRLLLGGYNGLYEWHEGTITNLAGRDGLEGPSMVSSLLELEDGRLVMGVTAGEDLRIHHNRRWYRLGREQGLPAGVAFHLAEAGGALWVAGMNGVYRLPLEELDRALADPAYQVRAEVVINSGMDRPGGQLGKCCNGAGNARGLLREGRLWLPTREGALLVDTRPPPVHAKQARVRVDRIQAQDRWISPEPGQPLELPAGARDLKFEFSTPTFQPMRVPHLRHRLLGYEQQWRQVEDGELRTATYTNLPPGDYVFEVADFQDGRALPGGTRLELHVPPRFYETLVFRLACLLALAGIPYLAYRVLQHRHARQREELERLVQERTRDLQAANARLQAISFTDPLTGLHNRRYLARQIPDDLSFYEREPGFQSGEEAAVFVLLDVDHFKSINDTHGHAAGDRVLEQLGQVLGALVRKGDYAVRWGGEEFLLVLRPLPRGRLADIGQRLCSELAAHDFDLGNGSCHRLTVSVGLIEFPLFRQAPRLLRWEQLVSLADRALYRAKHSGRNGWIAFRPTPGANPPSGSGVFEGDPWWLVETGALEMYGPDGQIPTD